MCHGISSPRHTSINAPSNSVCINVDRGAGASTRAEARARQKGRTRGQHPQGCPVLLPRLKSTRVGLRILTPGTPPFKEGAAERHSLTWERVSKGIGRERTQKSGFPGLPDHPTTRASAPPLRDSAQSNNPKQDATDFGRLVKWVVLRARPITAITVRPASLTFTRLRAELWSTNPSLATASGSPAIR